MVDLCLLAFLPPPDAGKYLLVARVTCASLGILLFLAAMAYRWKSEQNGNKIDEELTQSVRSLMACCAIVITFVDFSAIRFLVLASDAASQLSGTTCVLLALLPLVFGRFVYKMAPWIAGVTPSKVADPSSVVRDGDGESHGDGDGESHGDRVLNVAQEGSPAAPRRCGKCIKYSRLFLFTTMLSLFSTFSLVLTANVLSRNRDLKQSSWELQELRVKYDTNGDGFVSPEEFGLVGESVLELGHNASSLEGLAKIHQRRRLNPLLALGLIGEFVVWFGTWGGCAVAAESTTAVVVGGVTVAGTSALATKGGYDKYREFKFCGNPCGRGSCQDAKNLFGEHCDDLQGHGCMCDGCCTPSWYPDRVVSEPKPVGIAAGSTAAADILLVLGVSLPLMMMLRRVVRAPASTSTPASLV